MSVKLFDVTWGALTIQQCTSVNFQPGVNVVPIRGSSATLPNEFVVMGGEPVAQFSTMDLATVLAAIDETVGLAVSGGTIKLAYQVAAPGATYVSGANDIALSASSGQLIPQTITAQQGQPASMDLQGLFVSSDGETNPVSYAGSQTAGTPGYAGTFRLGPTSLNGSDVTGVVGITINFGITPQLRPTDGNTYADRLPFIGPANPTVDVQFETEGLLNTYGPMFASASAAVFSLIANADGGSISALTNTDHIKATCGAGIYSVQSFSAQNGEVAVPTLRLLTKSLSIATSQALA